MRRIGVIDIGANSIKLMLSEIEDSGYFKTVDELKETVRLGSDLINSNKLSEDKINYTISTLKSFKSLCTLSGASEIITVITEDLIIAENKNELKDKIIKEVDLYPRLLSYDDEIHYNHLSVINSLYTNNSLMIDIGGFSTHLALIDKNSNLIENATIPVGCVNLSKLFCLQDLIIFENNEKACDYVKSLFSSIAWLSEYQFSNIICIGGSLRNIFKVDRRKKRYPLDLSHNYSISKQDVTELYNLMKCKNLKQRKQIEGLSIDRADVIVGALVILNELVKHTNVEDLTLCGRGLREGILNEYLNQNYASSSEDILDFSIHGIMETLNLNISHANNVYNITKNLFESLKPIHKLKIDEYSNIIKTSSLLHDCGISVRYYDHHLHSCYIILNSHFNGLSHKEILKSGFSAAFHRNNSFQVPLSKYSQIINKLDVQNIEKIGTLLKISEGLDRSLEGAVKDFKVTILEDSIEILLYSKDPNNNLELEINQSLRAKSKFFEVYNKNLIIKKA